jgi:hypothetical protein
MFYWDEFLGLNDTNFEGQPAPTYCDRIFTTAVSLNALIDAWSFSVAGQPGLKWLPDVPASVQQACVGAASFLNRYATGDEYLPLNCFFSGSVKSLEQFPPFFPANFMQFINGTEVYHNSSQSALIPSLITGMQGIVSEEQYARMLDEKWFDFSVPEKFDGFNQMPFAFWNSEPLTYAFSLLGLSKLQVIQ